MANKPKRSMKTLFIFNALLLAVAFAMIQYAVVVNEEAPIADVSTVPTPILQGRMTQAMTVFEEPQAFLSDFTFKTSFDKSLTLDDLKGQWVILNFWASWCPPCLVEMPSLQKLQDQFGGQGVKVVGVSLDRNMNGEKLREVMMQHGFGPVAAYYDPDGYIMRNLSLKGLPTTYILMPNGQAFAKFEGDADWADADATAFIASLLAPAQP